MPKFLEKKLKARYGNNPHAIYGTLNKIGAMRGNKETAKGKAMAKKHSRDMKMKRGGKKMKTAHKKHNHGNRVPLLRGHQEGAMQQRPLEMPAARRGHQESKGMPMQRGSGMKGKQRGKKKGNPY